MIASTNVYHKCMKHIDIKYYYIRDAISAGQISIEAIFTKNNTADLLTKSLPHDQHKFLYKKYSLIDDSIMGEWCESKNN